MHSARVFCYKENIMTIEELQEWVKKDWAKSNVQPELIDQLLFAIEEFGEVAEAIRKKITKNDYKQDDDKLGSEFGDLFISLTTLANSFDVNITKELHSFQKKIAARRT